VELSEYDWCFWLSFNSLDVHGTDGVTVNAKVFDGCTVSLVGVSECHADMMACQSLLVL
jgi:hypothetical protein